MRIGLLGGAFDPPHLGHLKLAELALHHLELDELRFVPTAVSPNKPAQKGPDPASRLRLLEAALAGFPGPVKIETAELDRMGISYTAETLETLSKREPQGEWILVLGSDQLPGLPSWHRFPRVLELASIAVAPRPGFDDAWPESLQDREKPRWSGAPGEIVRLPGTELPYASSILRQRIEQGKTAAGLTPQVMAAIAAESLYRNEGLRRN